MAVRQAGNEWAYFGLSTDTKPTDVPVGSRLRETDTNDVYVWDGATWDIDPVANANVQSARSAVAITPADGADLATAPCRALYIGGAGNLSVILAADAVAVTFVGLGAGTVLPIAAKRVRGTGTTATNIVALY
jgi:hypothetical protein